MPGFINKDQWRYFDFPILIYAQFREQYKIKPESNMEKNPNPATIEYKQLPVQAL